jgi:biotin operon repressor
MWRVVRQDALRRVLRVLASDPDLGPAELGRRLGLSKAAVAHHLQRLEAWGFVERLRIGRQRLLRVTRPDLLVGMVALLDEERPSLAWPGLLLTQTRTSRVRPASDDRTPGVHVPTEQDLGDDRVPAALRSSSA